MTCSGVPTSCRDFLDARTHGIPDPAWVMEHRHTRPPRSRTGPAGTFLVECFATSAREIRTADRRARSLARHAAGPRSGIEYVAVLALPEDEQVLVLLRGPDAASVRTACLEAGLLVERVAAVTIRGWWTLSRDAASSRVVGQGAGCRR